MKIKFLFIKLALLTMLLTVTSCSGGEYCIEPDDFGQFYYTTVSSLGLNVQGERENQYAEWFPSTARLNGDKLYIVVKPDDHNMQSGWTTWYGNGQGRANEIAKLLPYCLYSNNLFAITNPPCRMKDGVGLYMLVANPKEADPNQSARSIKNPTTLSKINESDILHLGFNSAIGVNSNVFYEGQQVGGYFDHPPASWMGKFLYFKILDRYYTDNAGSYQIVIKSGVSDKGLDITGWIIEPIISTTKEITKRMFASILGNSIIITSVKVLLTLYVIITFLLFIMGMLRVQAGEVAMRMLKLGFIAVLLSPNAWIFLYDYFFIIFLEGLLELIGYVTGNNADDYSYFEPFIQLVLNSSIWKKILGLLNPFGGPFYLQTFAFGIIYIVSMVMLILASGMALTTFILAILGICLLILISPIFLVGILFNQTKQMFDSWLRMLISFSFQALLIVLFFTFIRDTAMTEIQRNLGYKVCWTRMASIPPLFEFWWFKPSIANIKANIDAPGYFEQNGRTCKPYECKSYRYKDMPFLIPQGNNEKRMGLLKDGDDQETIDHILHKGGAPIFDLSILRLLLLAFATGQIVTLAAAIAQIISGIEYSWGAKGGLAGVGMKMDALPKNMAKAGAKVGVRAIKTGARVANKIGLTDDISNAVKSTKAYKTLDKYAIQPVTQSIDAIKQANKALKDEAKAIPGKLINKIFRSKPNSSNDHDTD
ncbi:TrbL/VirB6 family protein [Rickettsiales endosymbiont of Stachyamoeba lipophora]|uniref:type IV secretion system protein n=1 Tax=Rickettsiales endosymbiont of Stachyamoeba lipophora TaxID=2486578 RepID=UPI000F64D4AB|nr:type IV secretion system protein [Rickettsiales endosymbiont of Stachyamoeba lipophora]AZL15803.1 hypothetical protein EF513_04495 [Rickettsiales endosymbiont of Stachyamoeba lipophora]